MYTALFHHGQLGIRTALPAGNDRTRMPHTFAGRCGDPGDKTDHRLFHVVLDPARAFLLVAAADLADHDHRVGLRVVIEQLHHIQMFQAVDRVAAYAHTGRLPQAQCAQLTDRFISQRTGTRHHADAPLAMDMTGHDADLDLIRRDQPRTIRPDQQRALARHLVARAQHVVHRYPLGDADHQIQIGFDRFIDCGRGIRGRHIDHRHRRAGLPLGFQHAVIDRHALEMLPAFVRRDPRHETRRTIRIRDAILSVELPYLTRHALRHHAGVFIDENRHYLFPLAAATTFCAASAMSLPEMIGKPDSARIFLPSSTFVPSKRTTKGTAR